MTVTSGFLTVAGTIMVIFTKIFIMSSLFLSNQSASGTFSGENGKIAFDTAGAPLSEIYVMNADGSGQTSIANDSAGNSSHPDWGSTGAQPPSAPGKDTTPLVLSVPDNKVVEATSEDGAQVRYTVTAKDNVDGNATLQEDGKTVTQDNVGGNITISCDPPSGSTFLVEDTQVECSATGAAGITGRASFTVTVNPPPRLPSDVTAPVITVPKDIVKEATSPNGMSLL
jgi:Tol biopolymer transport system component